MLSAKLLTVNDFAKYNFIISSIGIASALSSLGIPQLAVRKIITLVAENKGNVINKWVSESLVIQLLACVTISLIYSPFLLLKGYTTSFLILFLSLIIVNVVILFSSEVLRGLQRTLASLIIFEGARNAAIISTIVIFYYLTSTITFSNIIIINILCSLIIIFYFFRSKNKTIAVGDIKQSIVDIKQVQYKSITGESLPFLGIALLGFIQVNDSFILGFFLKETDLSTLSFAFKIFSMLLVFSNSTMMWFYPQIANFLIKKDMPALVKKTVTMIGLQLAGGIIFLACIYFFYDQAIQFVGDHYKQGKELVYIYTIGFILNSFVSYSTIYLTITGHEKTVILSLLVSILTYLTLSFILYPIYGLICIPLFFIITVFSNYIFLLIRLRKNLVFSPISYFIKSVK